jgi:hypothetical protein
MEYGFKTPTTEKRVSAEKQSGERRAIVVEVLRRLVVELLLSQNLLNHLNV